MISSLRCALDNDRDLNKYQFVIGAGVEGAKAFSSSSFAEKNQLEYCFCGNGWSKCAALAMVA